MARPVARWQSSSVGFASAPRTKREFAADALREAIVAGQLAPGKHLRLSELVALLGISATPIREAIRLLEAEGLLRAEPHRGVTVVTRSHADLVEIYWLRSGLEGVAAHLAVARQDAAGRARLVEQLQRLQDAMCRHVAVGHLRPVARLNRDFHFAIVDAAGSPRLAELIRRLWQHLPHHYLWQVPGRAAASLAQHELLLAAIRAGDPVAAKRAMQAHVRQAAETLPTALAPEPQQGQAPRASPRRGR